MGVAAGVLRPLSVQESAVFELAGRGYSAKRIAAVRSVAQRTVEAQIASIKQKTGAGSKDELIDLYLEAKNDG